MDTTADFITIIRNGYLAKKTQVTTNFSKLRGEIARILKDEAFIEDFLVTDAKPSKKITLSPVSNKKTSKASINNVK